MASRCGVEARGPASGAARDSKALAVPPASRVTPLMPP